MFEHGVEDDEELSGGSDDGDLAGFAGRMEAVCQVGERVFAGTHDGERSDVERAADGGTSSRAACGPAGFAALPVERREAGQRGDLPAGEVAQFGQVRDERMVGDGSGDAATPFVLDGVNFYLARNHRDECAVAALLRQRRALDEAHGADEADIDALFHGERGVAVELQRQAVRDVIGRRLFVLTGGPGTGKTTTVLRMLLMLQREAGRTLRIEVAAPTGKAAQRLAQSLRHGKDRMRSDPHAPLPPAWQPLPAASAPAGRGHDEAGGAGSHAPPAR